ncbi:MAG: efflux transporter outer membrane subunit [Proteobacteria bacterium]|jgi:multidrug efflux system outer membrane protein|nr:efflux transporter outer membrane subunit [Pseudomonadota bacterium]
MARPIALAGAALATLAALAGCASLAPPVPAPRPGVPKTFASSQTLAGTHGQAPASTGEVTAIDWRDFFVDPALQEVIGAALVDNRDLRVSVLNVERARAQYRIQRAQRVPTIGVGASESRMGGGSRAPLAQDGYTVALGLSSFEIDLFGRVRDLSRAALESYFALDATRRAARLTLIGEVASAWLTLGADHELLEVSRETLTSQEASYELMRRQHELGAVSGLDLAQAETTVATARSDVASLTGQVAADRDALELLVGRPLEPQWLPNALGAVTVLAAPPASLASEVLLRRPDVIAAEHDLRSANANIGAARAAFFPSITLTTRAGTISSELSGLFRGGSGFWSFSPQLNLPIFDSGALQGNLDVARANENIALAQYEKAVQSGFREVADALALEQTLARQQRAQRELVDAATRAHRLSLERYKAGRDSYVTLLVAQRTQYAAQQSLVRTRLAAESNRVALYTALGGDWREQPP